MRRGNIDLRHLKTLYLDEADEMLNKGFKEDVDEVILIIFLTFVDSFKCEGVWEL